MISKLQTIGIKELKRYSVYDFIKICSTYLLTDEVVKILDEARRKFDAQMMQDFYILAFVYRETSFFQNIMNEITKSLFPDEVEENKTLNIEEESLNPHPFWTKIAATPSLADIQLKALHEDAAFIMRKIKRLKEYCFSSARKSCKHYNIYKKIYDKEILKDCNVKELLQNISAKENLSFAALKRGYYRWKNDFIDNTVSGSSWPSDAFNEFCALLSVVYLPADRYAKEYILYEGPGFEVYQLRAALKDVANISQKNSQLKKQYINLQNDSDIAARENGMKKLAGQNYLPAVKYCSSISSNLSDRAKEKYKLQAAILGDVEWQKKRQWQAKGFSDLKMEICYKNQIRLANAIQLVSGAFIRQGEIINSIDFETDINKKEIAELMEFLEKTVVKEPEYFVLKKVQAWKKISVKASVKNIDILMKYAKSLPPNIQICFSSRHKKTMNSIYRTCFELMD